VAQVVNKGATTLVMTDATDPDYVGVEETWTVQLSPVAPAANLPAFVNPASGNESATIGSFNKTEVTM